jgi:hypothetical protein
MKAKLSTDYPLNFNNNIDPFVPPNPNEFVMTVSSPAFSTVSVAISSGFNAGSNVSTLIDGAIKSFSSISRQYTASDAPVAPCEWPVINLVDDTGGVVPSPNTRRTASISSTSPTGGRGLVRVDVTDLATFGQGLQSTAHRTFATFARRGNHVRAG